MIIQRIKTLSAILLAGATATAASVSAKENTKPYPYGNPVIKHMYTADASPHVMPDGRVWMITSVDRKQGGGYSTMHAYHTFSSADMLNWVDHGQVFHVSDVNPNEDPKTDDWALWAPDVIYHEGKYYMYYPIHIRHRKDIQKNGRPRVTSYIGVAVSDALDKPFTILKDHIEGTRGIDPSILVDDDGQKYLYWGQKWVAKLKDNMYELASKPQQLDIGAKNFMEAPWVHKRDGEYFFNYHTKYNNKVNPQNPDDAKRQKSRLDYAVSDQPMGPYQYKGVLNYELGVNVNEGPKAKGKKYVPWRLTQSNHGGVVEFHGQDYLFYHTSALSSWNLTEFKGKGDWTRRSVCVDEINYDAQGNLIPVQQTITGPKPVKIDQPFELKAKGAFQFTDKQRVQNLGNFDFGSGYYYFDAKVKGSESDVSGKFEIRLDRADGLLVGTIDVDAKKLKQRRGLVDVFLREVENKRDVYLVYKPDQSVKKKVKVKNVRFFAGSPKAL